MKISKLRFGRKPNNCHSLSDPVDAENGMHFRIHINLLAPLLHLRPQEFYLTPRKKQNLFSNIDTLTLK